MTEVKASRGSSPPARHRARKIAIAITPLIPPLVGLIADALGEYLLADQPFAFVAVAMLWPGLLLLEATALPEGSIWFRAAANILCYYLLFSPFFFYRAMLETRPNVAKAAFVLFAILLCIDFLISWAIGGLTGLAH